jgi:hypothetical protein
MLVASRELVAGEVWPEKRAARHLAILIFAVLALAFGQGPNRSYRSQPLHAW